MKRSDFTKIGVMFFAGTAGLFGGLPDTEAKKPKKKKPRRKTKKKPPRHRPQPKRRGIRVQTRKGPKLFPSKNFEVVNGVYHSHLFMFQNFNSAAKMAKAVAQVYDAGRIVNLPSDDEAVTEAPVVASKSSFDQS